MTTLANDKHNHNPLLRSVLQPHAPLDAGQPAYPQLPEFDAILPEHVQPAVEHLLAQCREAIEQAASQIEPTWENLVLVVEEVEDALEKVWSSVSHLNNVMSTPELREAHDACLPLLSDYATYTGQHQGLYQAYLTLSTSATFQKLSAAQQRVITETLKDFKLSGVVLNDEDKKRYAELQSRLSELSSQFSNNLLDATHAWFYHTEDQGELAGLPESALQAAAAEAKDRELNGWVFTLDIPSYLPVMMYADRAELRHTLYQAYTTRASQHGPNAGEFDNTNIMKEILELRQELAQLLGFDNYAQLSLETKMAKHTDEVMGFLQDLGKRSSTQAQADYQEIVEYAKRAGNQDPQVWDLSYYSEKLKQEAYSISDEQLRPYFSVDKVVEGLFSVVRKLFGVHFKQDDSIKTYHPDVRYYHVLNQDDEVIAGFYFDLYARAQKRGGAWMSDYSARRQLAGSQTIQKPIAFLTCNFNKPQGDQPALFTHDEVVTLFHEFGHGLHHMLTQVAIGSISGISGVPWDAVELPSQFLENWCWQPEALALISGHYETGEPLPQDLLERMLAAKNFQSAMQMVRQLEFALFDMLIHLGTQSGQAIPANEDHQRVDIQATLDAVRQQVAVVIPPHFNQFQHSFAHIFAGGYAAGYYSYKWAEVLSADAFAKFEEEGIFNPETGTAFKTHILEKGGSADIADLFRAFRGREPDIQALLRHSGIQAA